MCSSRRSLSSQAGLAAHHRPNPTTLEAWQSSRCFLGLPWMAAATRTAPKVPPPAPPKLPPPHHHPHRQRQRQCHLCTRKCSPRRHHSPQVCHLCACTVSYRMVVDSIALSATPLPPRRPSMAPSLSAPRPMQRRGRRRRLGGGGGCSGRCECDGRFCSSGGMRRVEHGWLGARARGV